jgi:hypothetical protein
VGETGDPTAVTFYLSGEAISGVQVKDAYITAKALVKMG